MLFPSTEGTRSYSLSGIKSRINGHHRQSDHKFVAETKKKKNKPSILQNAASTLFKNTNRIYSDPTSCLFVVVIHIIRTGNRPQALNKKGRERVCIAPRLRAK